VRASNIVIRNLRIHHVEIGDKDAISIEGPADHIWVDHCELYAEYEGVDKDFYDGLLDAKAEAEYITYSWNYLHDSWKAALAGSSEDDTFDRKLTAHHNWFRTCNSRLPLFRGGNGHVFNNYYLDILDTGINSRSGACLRIEGNYFENAQNPWVSAFTDALGGGELSCNVLAGTTAFAYMDDVHELPTCTANVPYDYASVLSHPESVPALVMANAGVGKLDDPTAF
jgi:pectate lyase